MNCYCFKAAAVALLSAAAISIQSCTPEEAVEPPVITSGDITVPAEAHTATLSYSIENPVSGGSIKAESDQDWLHSFNYDTGLLQYGCP